MQIETIALLKNGYGIDLASYVQHVFKDAETAHKFANKQNHNLRIVRVPGKVKVGDRIEHNTKLGTL